MENLVIDLALIKEKARSDQASFQEFKQSVKKISIMQFDALAHPIVNEITQAIDCTQCGNCCRSQEPGVTMDEVEKLARLKELPVENFKDQYIAWDREGISFLCVKPCTFLSGNICSVYHSRPASCADFPGLHRPRLKWRMKQVEENYSICPIVFNVVEKLKTLLPSFSAPFL